MELAVLSDIHSNYVALERCMEYAFGRGISRFVFLGDYIGEFAYPERTMEQLLQYREKYDCVFIRGNKEDYWAGYRKGGEQGWPEYSSVTGALYYAYRHLSKRDLDFLHGLPVTAEIAHEGLPVLTACHGSPVSVRESMRFDDGSAERILDREEKEYVLCGHTHLQGKTCRSGRTALNPGSAGMSLGAGGMAQFAVLSGTDGQWKEEFISLDFDRERMVREMKESGLWDRAPYWCRITERLLLGREGQKEVGHGKVLQRAMELCRQDTGACNWPDIPEKYMERAAGELLGG